MNGHIYIILGDITQLSADAITYSTSPHLGELGDLHSAFAAHVPGFSAQYARLERIEPGEAHWLPLQERDQPYGVVVVAATGGSGSARSKAYRAVQAAITTAHANLKERLQFDPQKRLLIALPAFRLGKGGDIHRPLASARAQIEAARDTLRDSQFRGVDVVFVTYTPAIYQAFLDARRKVLDDRPPPGVEFPPALVKALSDGECVLFLGAGLSRGAGMPGWQELIDQLQERLNLARDHRRGETEHYLDVAQWFREQVGSDDLNAIIRELFGNQEGRFKPTLAHYWLMAMPVRHVLTTNYDNLLEQTLLCLRRYPVQIVEQTDVARTGQSEGVSVVKFHGDALLGKNIVLSRDDYDSFFESRPAMSLLLQGLLLNQTFFFVGYGLQDPNFRQVYNRIGRMLQEARRPAFALTFDPINPYLAQQWRQKQMHLLEIPGSSWAQKEQCYFAFLDRLAELVTSDYADHLFLATDAETTAHLQPLRASILDSLARQVIDACLKPLTAEEARQIAQVLEFLTTLGWRAALSRYQTVPIAVLWKRLADCSANPATRRRMLIKALRYTESLREAEEIRKQIEAIGE